MLDGKSQQPFVPTINGFELIPDEPKSGTEFLDLQTPIILNGLDKGPTYSVPTTTRREQVKLLLT